MQWFCTNLLLGWGAELFGFASSEGSGHVERLHDFVIAEALIILQVSDEVVREGHDRLDPVPDLTVTQILQQVAHLVNRETGRINQALS